MSIINPYLNVPHGNAWYKYKYVPSLILSHLKLSKLEKKALWSQYYWSWSLYIPSAITPWVRSYDYYCASHDRYKTVTNQINSSFFKTAYSSISNVRCLVGSWWGWLAMVAPRVASLHLCLGRSRSGRHHLGPRSDASTSRVATLDGRATPTRATATHDRCTGSSIGSSTGSGRNRRGCGHPYRSIRMVNWRFKKY